MNDQPRPVERMLERAWVVGRTWAWLVFPGLVLISGFADGLAYREQIYHILLWPEIRGWKLMVRLTEFGVPLE